MPTFAAYMTETTQSFEALGLKPALLKAIAALGYQTPTPIQAQAIPALLQKPGDLIGLAQTGTGKTAAFGLPLIQLTDFTRRTPQALIICPTRELCLQIARDLTGFLSQTPEGRVTAIYGGASIEGQIRDLQRGTQVVVATPGRMVDLINRGKVSLAEVGIVVLDEADEMLNMGFKEDLDTILSKTPDHKHTWLFSATMAGEVARIARTYMHQPMEVSIGKQNQGAANIEHHYYIVQARDRYLALKRIVDYYPEIFGIVFCRTRAETQEIAEKLIHDGYNADALHGDLSQGQRDAVMARYRSRTLQVLVATDVAARGIDVNNVTHVIHYNIPDDVENYTHRSGRTARAGKSGISIALLNLREANRIKELERLTHSRFQQKLVPNGPEVCEKQLFNLVRKIHDAEVREEEISDFLPPINAMLQDLSKEELIKRMVSTDFNRFLEYYQDAPDLNTQPRKPGAANGAGPARAGRPGRLFINLGEMDGLHKLSLRDFLCKTTQLEKHDIGRIDLRANCSFFEVDPRLTPLVKEAFARKVKYGDRAIRIDDADGAPPARTRTAGSRPEGSRPEGKPAFNREKQGGSWDRKGPGKKGGYPKRRYD